VLLADRLIQGLARSRRQGSHLGVMFLDVDHFKTVNDSFGHDVGDLLLQEVASRLKKCVRPTDTVARLGGDEFLIIFTGLTRAEDVTVVANKVSDCFAPSFLMEGHKINVKAGIGISLFPEHGEDQETLIKAADYAMYLAKKRGKSFVICPPDKYSADKDERSE
jgi:diguanylate cyclase (GGDEF)-like protein